jgi:hypothetical protein
MINITYQTGRPYSTLRFEEKRLPFFALVKGHGRAGALAFVSADKSDKGYRAYFLDDGHGIYIDLEEQIQIMDHQVVINI